MLLLLLLLPLLLRSPQALGASNFHLRNHTGLLFLYGFGEGQRSEALPTETRDLSGMNLLGNLMTSTSGSIAWSAQRQGISVPGPSGGMRAISSKNTTELLNHLSDEFTIEMIFSNPTNPLSQGLTIAGFGTWAPGAPFEWCDIDNVTHYGGWRLFSFLGGSVAFEPVLVAYGEPECVSQSISMINNRLYHIAFRVQTDFLSILVVKDGHSNAFGPITFSTDLWKRNPAPLTIATPNEMTGWTGSIYMIAMYNRFLPEAEYNANLDFGPPNSLPYSTTSSLFPLEDSSLTIYP